MKEGRNLAGFQTSRFTTWGLHLQPQLGVEKFRYRHVLVSTRLSTADRAALLLGFELASLHESTLTLLHVLPRFRQDRPSQGLDAIGLLHAAAEPAWRASPAIGSFESESLKIHRFVKDIVPRGLLDAVGWRGESRGGDVTGTIVSYVNESAADLVILPKEPFRWWLPIGAFSRIIERRTQASVIVIRGQATSLLS